MIRFQFRKSLLRCLVFSRDGTRLFAAGASNQVQVWNLQTGRLHTNLIAEGLAHIESLHVAPDGLTVHAFHAKTICSWDLRSERPDRRYRRPNGTILFTIALSPSGTHLAASGWMTRPTLALYTFPDLEECWRVEVTMQERQGCLAFSTDGKELFHGGHFGHIGIHNGATGELLHHYKNPYTSIVKALAPSPDGQFLAWAAHNHLFLAQLDPFRVIADHNLSKNQFLAVAFHPSGRFFASANGDGKVDYWHAKGDHWQAFDWGVGKVNAVTFDAEGHRAACCSKTGEIVIWDVDE